MLADRLRGMLWTAYLRARGARVGRSLQVHSTLDILLRDGATLSAVTIGDNVALGGRIYLRLRRRGRIMLGTDIRIGTEVWLVTANEAELSIGDHTVLGSYSIYNGGHGITIGPNCLFAAFVYLNSSDHQFRRGELIRNQGHVGAPIAVGADVWLGGRVAVTQGVRIGEGAVIGVGAVVTKDVPPYALAVGVPARVIKYRG